MPTTPSTAHFKHENGCLPLLPPEFSQVRSCALGIGKAGYLRALALSRGRCANSLQGPTYILSADVQLRAARDGIKLKSQTNMKKHEIY